MLTVIYTFADGEKRIFTDDTFLYITPDDFICLGLVKVEVSYDRSKDLR